MRILKFIIEKPREAIIIILLILLGILSYKYHLKERKIQELIVKRGELTEKLKSRITIKNDKVIIVYKDKKEIAKKKIIDVPPEGKVDIYTPKEGEKVDKLKILEKITIKEFEIPESSGTIVRAKIGGLTFKPGFGIIYNFSSKNLLGELDFKFIYYRRWSTMLFVSKEFGGVSISRHIDDMIFFKNVEVAIFYGVLFENMKKTQIGIGLRSNF